MPDARTANGPLGRVGLAFLINGIASSVWIVRTPRLAERLGTTPGRLGLLFAIGAIGGVVGSRIAPRTIRGRAPARVMALSGFTVGVVLILRGVPTSIGAFALVQAFAGVTDGIHDVSMNAEGVRIDAVGRRSIMNRLHGVWSVGALLGGVIGVGLASTGIGFDTHMYIAGGVLVLANVPMLGAFGDHFVVPEPVRRVPGHGRVSSTIVVLCVVGIAVALTEGAPNDWGSIYLRDHLHTGEGVAGLTTVAFAGAMVVCRFAGDHAVERFGAMRVLRAGAVAAAFGLVLGLGVDQPWSIICGWAFVGAGVATAFPALFVAGARLPGVAPEVGMGILTSVARVGFLLGPLAIGRLVDARGIRVALLVPLAASIVVAVGTGRLSSLDRDSARRDEPPGPQAGSPTISM